jgi:hypothetical protein
LYWNQLEKKKFFNPSSDNPALEGCPKTRCFAFYLKAASSVKRANIRDMFKKASNSVCTLTIVVSPDPISYSVNFSREGFRKQLGTMMTLNQQRKEIFK